MKLNRNDPCWCGSTRKYKSCHLNFDQRLSQYESKGILIPPHSILKSPSQIEGIRKAGVLNTALLDYISPFVKEGVSTEYLNSLAHKFTIDNGGFPATLGYDGFPKSICTSVNDEVCHGIPSKDVILTNGDIVNVDVTTILNGYFADASRMYEIGTVSNERKNLIKVAKECLEVGIANVKPYGFLGDIGDAIDAHAKKNGCSVVRDIGGHGTGLAFHEDPWVGHFGTKGSGMLLVPGMVFTIEPMVNAGVYDVYENTKNNWTYHTKDGKDSAQWEHTLVVTDDGYEIIS